MKIFIEAETFDDLGGWTVDSQAMEAMGACYLLAHGAGRPVADALHRFAVPYAAHWRVFVRTRDWTAVWGRGRSAGRFTLQIDGGQLGGELGTNGSRWAWQRAGGIELAAGSHTVALHDLTGFDGRCDAVYLTDEADDIPPEEGPALARLRRECAGTVIADDPENYDLIVCGGGFAGVCHAVAAKKSGLRVLALNDRPVVGGCGSSEIRVWVGGRVNTAPYPELGNVAEAISPVAGQPGMKKEARLFEDERKAILLEKGRELLLNEIVVAVERDEGNPRLIRSVVTRAIRTGRLTRRHARLFTDATGDAFVARQAGCRTMYGTEGRDEFNEPLAPPHHENTVMGHSVLWETARRGEPVAFPDIDWGIGFNEDNAIRRFDCCWDWEAGQFRNQVQDIEFIRDYGMMACYANWSFLKNRSVHRKEWENMDLEWVSAIGGKRESYRVVGGMILTYNDMRHHVVYPDATGCATWSIDLHYADPANCARFGEPFQSCAYHYGLGRPYPIPYRCLYAADIDNLFLAGRCLSMTHIAFSCVRVMRTLGMLGEVAAMAASLCCRYNCTPAEIYGQHLKELQELMSRGIGMRSPCSYETASDNAFHFMRPVGMYGNDSENCWIKYNDQGQPVEKQPEGLQKSIDALAVSGLIRENCQG